MAAHQLPASSRKRSRRVLGMQTTKHLQRFYGVEVFRLQPPIPGSQGSETVSLPCGTSAFDPQQSSTRVNRARVEGTSPSTGARGLNDFLLFQAYRLWMEYPSRGNDENRIAIGGIRAADFDRFRT